VIELPWPPAQLSPNARVHWAKRSKVAKRYRSDCYLLTKAAKVQAPAGQIAFGMLFCPPDRRSYDDDNLVARMKHGRDGVADALGVDDRNFVTTFRVGDPVKGGAVRITISAFNQRD
jgi:crossover junction endodeoxyribonuclease RusA